MENGPLQDEPTQDSCTLADTFKPFSMATFGVKDGILASLPGGVRVQDGPKDAVPKGDAVIANIIEPFLPVVPVPTSHLPPLNTDLPAQVYTAISPDVGIFQQATTSTTLSTSSTPPPPPPPVATPPPPPVAAIPPPPPPPAAAVVTPAPVAPYPVAQEDGNGPVSTRTITTDGVVQEIVYYEDIVYVTEEIVTTTTVGVTKSSKMKHRRNHIMRNRHI